MNDVLIGRHIDADGVGLVLKDTIDCETSVIDARGNVVLAKEYDGVLYIPCSVGDRIIIYYKNKKYSRTFKVKALERTEQFYICEIIYTIEESTEMELLAIAEQVKNGDITTNEAHLRADQLIVSLLYNNKLDAVADAYNKVPKYYE